MSDGGGQAATAPSRILELGCGFNKTPGAFGVDIIAGSQADLVHDLNVFPYPFADSSWDRIICRDVLEHVEDFVRTMEEIWRVGSKGAMVEVVAPFMSSVNYYSDPTHRRAFTSRSFDYFIDGTRPPFGSATRRLASKWSAVSTTPRNVLSVEGFTAGP